MTEYRKEKDSLGEVSVPADALWAAQTQRALENFSISGQRFPREFIRALALIKAAAAETNAELGLLSPGRATAIAGAAAEVAQGKWDDHFPLDIFQTGSGTSTNMNANEVIASLASGTGEQSVHPNDHVNMCQSSNDVIPTAIHVSATIMATELLVPSLSALEAALTERATELKDVVKTGRSHLMDAMPITLGQEIGGWAAQVGGMIARLEGPLGRVRRLALGGTAVGTGVNAHPEFAKKTIARLSVALGAEFTEAPDHFAAQSSMDDATELSGSLKTAATALMKIANDVRLLGSGPLAGLGELTLPALQPGSSIMPGKVNPVMCEAVMMSAAQVIANDLAVTIGNGRGNFQLNTMLPLIAHNLLGSMRILGNSARLFAQKTVSGLSANRENIARILGQNPILVTSLNPIIGYERAAEIAKLAYLEGRPVLDVAQEVTGMERGELERLLDPEGLTKGGLSSKS